MKNENPKSAGRPIGSKDSKKRKAKKAKIRTKIKKPATPAEMTMPAKIGHPIPNFPHQIITPHPRVGDDVKKYGPQSKEFESKLDDLREPQPEKAKPAKTAKTAMPDVSGLEVKIIANFLKLPFATWASRIDFPAIRLTDKEALEWAEPTKVLLDYYLPIIPPIAYAWFAWSITTISIVNSRLELIAAIKRKQGESQAEPTAGPVEAPKQGAPSTKPQKV